VLFRLLIVLYQDVETGLLRETTSFFLAAYFFPGCEAAGSVPPTKMVRDTYTTCFRYIIL
jgi:hypothetical protein